MTKTPHVFMSYAQFDDDFEGGALRRFRDELSRTLRFVSGNEMSIFQEGADVKLGEQVQERISQSLNEAMVLVPVLTPSFFTDPTCRNILTRFLERERQLGRDDLVLTVYYQRVPDLEYAQESTDPLLRALAQRHPLDWQPLRGKDFNDPQVRQALERLAERIVALVEELQRIQQTEPLPLASTIQNTSTEQDDVHDDVSPEQIELLTTFIQATRDLPHDQRQPFIFAVQRGNDTIVSRFVRHPGLPQGGMQLSHDAIDDIEDLIETGFLRQTSSQSEKYSTVVEFAITKKGYRYADQQSEPTSATATQQPSSSVTPTPKWNPAVLTLRFAPTADGVAITWNSIAGGTYDSTFVMPYNRADLPLVVKALDAAQHPDHPYDGPAFAADEQTRLQELRLWQQGRVSPDAHRIIGQQLYAALIDDREGEMALRITREAARSQGQSLSYVLRFPADAVELAALPWEAIWDERQAVLLSRGARQIDSMERYIELNEALSPPLPRDKTLHILALSPRAGIPTSVRDEERAARLQSWEKLKAQGVLDWDELSPVTARTLNDRIRRGPEPDIIHYYGHGSYRNGQGHLLLDSETLPGQHEWVAAPRLAALLGGIRLIVIHACQSAMVQDNQGPDRQQSELFTGIAPALSAVSEAVVAMQLTVRISAATRFSEVFYTELARGYSLQAAVADARRSLYVEESDGASWYVPTLYIRTRNQEPLYVVQYQPTPEASPQPPPAPEPAEHRQTKEYTPGVQPTKLSLLHMLDVVWEALQRIPGVTGILGLLGVVGLILGLLGFALRDVLPAQPQPMDPGGWNLAVAGIGVVDVATDTVERGEDGEILSNQIEEVLAPQASDTRKWDDPGVDFVLGNIEERREHAEEIAEELNASVVVYGTTQPSGRTARFAPEFYVREPDPNYLTFIYGAEILGNEQFGKPVTYTRSIQGGSDDVNTAMEERIESLGTFLKGLQEYYADNFGAARAAFCDAIPQAELVDNRCVTVNEQNSEDDASHTAVVHLYLGALEFLEGNRDDALRHAHIAQTIWPEYPRPLITKGAIFFSLANEQHDQLHEGTYSPPADDVPLDGDLSCAEVDTILSLSIEDNLELAQRCYEEALEINR